MQAAHSHEQARPIHFHCCTKISVETNELTGEAVKCYIFYSLVSSLVSNIFRCLNFSSQINVVWWGFLEK